MLGYLDDVILLPILIWLTVQLLPAGVLEDSRQKAEQWMAESDRKPRSVAGSVAIVLIWTAAAVALSVGLATALAH